MVSKYNLKNKLRVAIVAVDQRITGALKMAGLASSFLDYTKGNGDINPHLNNLASLCHILLIYPSDLFHPSFRNINTKCIPHPPRPALKNFIITDDDFAKAFMDLLDKDVFTATYRYETYYGLVGREGWPRRSPTVLNAECYLDLMNISLYEFFLYVEDIAWKRIRSENECAEK